MKTLRFLLSAAFLTVTLNTVHAANKLNFQTSGLTPTASGVKVGLGPGFDTRIPMAPVNSTLSGWSTAGNYGVTRDATGQNMNMLASGEAILSGTKYPFQAAYKVPVSAITTALSVLCGNPIACLALSVATPYLTDWLLRSDARVTPTGTLERKTTSACTVDCFYYHTNMVPDGKATSPAGACRDLPVGGYFLKWEYTSGACRGFGPDDEFRGSQVPEKGDPRQVNEPSWLPSSMDDIAPYMQRLPFDITIPNSILQNGGDISVSSPTLTGPSSIALDPKTTTNPDGSKTTIQETRNFQTTGDTINNTTNTTTTTIYNADNSVRSTSTVNAAPAPSGTTPADAPPKEDSSTDTPLPAQPKLYKQRYPDGLTGVWKTQHDLMLGTPLFTVAKNLMPSVASSGQCPTMPVNLTFSKWADFGVKDFAPPCQVWDWGRAICIVSALLLARQLIFGG